MRVTVPFAYTARLQAPISKRIEDVVKTEMISHDIPEISSAETTLVATWQHLPPYRYDPQSIECRTYGGDYLYPMGDGRSVTASEIRHALSPTEGYAGMNWYYVARHAWFYDGNRQEACRNALHSKTAASRAKSAVELKNDREIELEKATKGLSDLIFIDDAIWCRALPPRLVLSVQNSGAERRGTIGIVASPLSGSPAGLNHPMRHDRADDRYKFRLAAMGEAEEFAERSGITCEKLVRDLSILEDIDMGLHHETWLTLYRATEAVERVGRKVGNLPTDVVARWLDLRSLASGFDESMIDEIGRSLLDLQVALEQHGSADPRLSTYLTDIHTMRSLSVRAVVDRSAPCAPTASRPALFAYAGG
ncbi:hypothetical protein OIU34_20395 [Pararhizobium sp. BT-229]|uniref:hypothetical protein n=1 Tax=Pararhizobium sp. BT-229 TaxID=2986923 RepID=UPI0021F7D1F4|nr:hypothetical protein [Pararhizobium sp. BT-229]MCV9964249.1 hypothetical protein [Pararhizobium sp. BT-229]